jgi:serine/threonine protein kinase
MNALLEMTAKHAESEPADRPKAATRFTYPSGSRPLDGYTIKRGVGRGGFGEVYFAVSDAGKEVALKLIRRNLEIELRGVTQCLNLKHPHLVSVYDIRTDEHDDHWVVMEYVSGASLEDVIDRYPEGMPRDLALHWFEGICSAVAYLHDHGIVHRDLKPANIFLDEGRVKIGDYGLSKFISCSRRSGQTESVGTVHYMAPEIANGRYGKEIDSYALGIILYEMLTGHVPFEGESVGEVLMKHLTAEPDLSGLEEPYASVVRGAMAKDPQRRINDAADMWAMLKGEKPVAVGNAALRDPSPRKHYDGEDDHAVPSPAGPVPMYGLGPNPAAPPPRPPHVPHGPSATDEEPILAALKSGVHSLVEKIRWNEKTPAQRVVITFLAVSALIASSELWLPILMPFTMVCLVNYGIYRVFRKVFRKSPTDGPIPATYVPVDAFAGSPATAPTAPLGSSPPGTPRQRDHLAETRPWRRRQATWVHAAHAHLAARPLRERVSETTGSMIVATGLAALASLFVATVSGGAFNGSLWLWSFIVVSLGSWALMAPAKLTEGKVEDQAPLRLTQLLLGALVGAAGWLVADATLLQLPVVRDFAPFPNDSVFGGLFRDHNGWLDATARDGAVKLPATMYMAYFAFVFVLLRWWRQAEWTRPSRLSVWSLVVCAFAGWVTSLLWWFPQPLGMAVTTAIALCVQLASPWCPPSRRRKLAETAVA